MREKWWSRRPVSGRAERGGQWASEQAAPVPSGEELPAYDVAVGWDADAIFELMLRFYASHPQPPGTDDPRFLEWLAHELHERQSHEVRRDIARQAAAFADHMVGELGRSRQPFLLFEHSPEYLSAPAAEPLTRAVDTASRAGRAPAGDLSIAAGTGCELWDQLCEQWVELPREVPPGRHLALTVAGDSMEPLLYAGDVVLVRLGPDAARGSVVVARLPEAGYVVKSVGHVDRFQVELRSLNAAYEPLRIWRSGDAVLGTVVGRWSGPSPRRRHGGAHGG